MTTKTKNTALQLHNLIQSELGGEYSSYHEKQAAYDLFSYAGVREIFCVKDRDMKTICRALTRVGIQWDFKRDKDFSAGIRVPKVQVQ